MNIKDITLERITKLYRMYNYPISPIINICGIRSINMESNTFDDLIVVFTNELIYAAPATTDPGLYYRNNPINVEGTAILPIGYHKDIWKIGKHRGRYTALVQRGICRVIRDNDNNSLLNYIIPPNAMCTTHTTDTYYNYNKLWDNNISDKDKGVYEFRKGDKTWKIDIGYFGINLHRARNNHSLPKVVDKFSAGCQVVYNYGDWLTIMGMVEDCISYPTGGLLHSYSYALFLETQLINL